MEQGDGALDVVAVEMGIDFGGGDAFVPQHLLHGAEVGATFHKVRGERVAEGVRTDGFGDAGRCSQCLDNQKDHLSCKLPATAGEKNDILTSLFDFQVLPLSFGV